MLQATSRLGRGRPGAGPSAPTYASAMAVRSSVRHSSNQERMEFHMSAEELRKAWIDLAAQHDWDDYMAVNFNCRSTIATGRKQFGKLCQRLDRSLLGAKYLKRSSERTFIIAFPEHILSNFHFHCLVKYNCRWRPPRRALQDIVQLKWKELVPSGTIHLQNAFDPGGAARYSTKEVSYGERLNDIVLSSQFWPNGTQEEHSQVDFKRLHTLKERTHYANRHPAPRI